MENNDITARIDDCVSMCDVAEDICGLSVRKRGGRGYCLCPLPQHNDTNMGSCILNEKYGHCFACSESFDAIKLVELTQGVKFRQAVTTLAEYYHLEVDWGDNPTVDPLVIPEKVLRCAGILDTTAFKKFFAEDRESAFRYLAIRIVAAKKRYASCQNIPPELVEEVQRRIKILSDADAQLPEWRKNPGPLRIK